MATVTLPTEIQARTPQGRLQERTFTDFKDPENARNMKAALELVGGQLGREYHLIIGRTPRLRPRARFVAGSVPTVASGGRTPESGRRTRGTGHAGGAEAFDFGAGRRSRRGLRCCLLRRRLFASGSSSSARGSRTRWARTGRRRTRTSGRRSIFLSFMRARHCGWRRRRTPIQLPGERNELHYIPLGVGAVIPPWNFPFAIMAGMTAAAIVTGNTVILKPSSDSPTIAAKFMEVLEEAGMPGGVVNFCPGSGAALETPLWNIPRRALLRLPGRRRSAWTFTSARQRPKPGQIWIKRTILEMGGKDSIVVCADTELDAAVDGVMASAFGFSGQKCSACSRAIVEALGLRHLCRAAAGARGEADGRRPGRESNMGPVVNKAAMDSILGYIAKGKKKAGWLQAAMRS